MKKFSVEESLRRFFIYAFPDVADDASNFDLTLLTDSDFYVTSVSSVAGHTFFIYNLSIEKQTIPTRTPTQAPIISGNGGTPYFLPLPWKLKAGTILRLVRISGTDQVSIAGYRS